MNYLKCTFTRCDKTVLNVEYLQAHILKKHCRFAHLEDLDEALRNGSIKCNKNTPKQDQRKKRQPVTHCKRGHALTIDNCYIVTRGKTCRTCTINRNKLRYANRHK